MLVSFFIYNDILSTEIILKIMYNVIDYHYIKLPLISYEETLGVEILCLTY